MSPCSCFPQQRVYIAEVAMTGTASIGKIMHGLYIDRFTSVITYNKLNIKYNAYECKE